MTCASFESSEQTSSMIWNRYAIHRIGWWHSLSNFVLSGLPQTWFFLIRGVLRCMVPSNACCIHHFCSSTTFLQENSTQLSSSSTVSKTRSWWEHANDETAHLVQQKRYWAEPIHRLKRSSAFINRQLPPQRQAGVVITPRLERKPKHLRFIFAALEIITMKYLTWK